MLYIIIFIFLSTGLFMFIYYSLRRSITKNNIAKVSTEKIKHNNVGKKIFICNSAEDLGHENMLQLYGESFGTPLFPNMKLIDNRGVQFKILEVYADDNTPEVPDVKVEAGIKDTPIVISNTNWDWNYFSEILKRDAVVVFRLEN